MNTDFLPRAPRGLVPLRIRRGAQLRKHQQARLVVLFERSDSAGMLEHQRYNRRCVDVAGPQVHHLWRRPEQDAHSSEVVVLREDREFAFTSCCPDVGVEPAAEAEYFNVRATWIRRLQTGDKLRTQVLVDEKPHAPRSGRWGSQSALASGSECQHGPNALRGEARKV